MLPAHCVDLDVLIDIERHIVKFHSLYLHT
jgi:hypothetical protein